MPSGAAPTPSGAAAVVDVTFVDDSAFFVMCRRADGLADRVSTVVRVILAVFQLFGLHVNFAKGKTEVLMALRGPGVQQAKRQLAESKGHEHGPGAGLRNITINSTTSIICVDSYKHLGSHICNSTCLVREANFRASSALAAFGPLSKTVFASACFSTEGKLAIAWSLIFSRLFYNTHTWSRVYGRAIDIISNVYHRVLRRILQTPRFGSTTLLDSEVRAQLAVPSASEVIKVKRLKYLPRLANASFMPLDAILQASHSGKSMPWTETVWQDVVEMQTRLKHNFSECDSPTRGDNFLFNVTRSYPKEWKLLVAKFQDCLVYDNIEQCRVAKLHRAMNTTPAVVSVGAFVCSDCPGKSFSSEKALLQHKHIMHNRMSCIPSRVGDWSVCPVCDTDFHSRSRLIAHLSDRRNRSVNKPSSCHHAFMSDPSLHGSSSEALNDQHRSTLSAAYKDGRTHEIAHLPAVRGRPSILKGVASLKLQGILRRRILRKSSLHELREFTSESGGVKHNAVGNNSICVASTMFSFGIDTCGLAEHISFDSGVTLMLPPKKRRISSKRPPQCVVALAAV